MFQSGFMKCDAVLLMPSAGSSIIHKLVVSILLGLLRGLVEIFHRALGQAGLSVIKRKNTCVNTEWQIFLHLKVS